MLVDIVCSYVLKAAYPETYDQVWGIQEQSKRCINMSVCMCVYIYIYISRKVRKDFLKFSQFHIKMRFKIND